MTDPKLKELMKLIDKYASESETNNEYDNRTMKELARNKVVAALKELKNENL